MNSELQSMLRLRANVFKLKSGSSVSLRPLGLKERSKSVSPASP